MYVFLVLIFIVVAFLLIGSILMQSSKGGGLAGAFGGSMGGGANAVFGGRGAASFLSKATQYLAIIFFVLTILINMTIRTRTEVKSVAKEMSTQQRAVTPSSALPKPAGIDIVDPIVPVENKSETSEGKE